MTNLVFESLIEFRLNEENKLKGGKGDKTKSNNVCPKQLAVGKLVEKEHSSDPKKSKEIALDHLTENKFYYSELVERGLVDEPAALRMYVKQFGKAKFPKKYEKILKEKE
jgi:hypothetical protein